MEEKFRRIVSSINKFKTEIMITILLVFLISSLFMGLQIIFITCLIVLFLIIFNDFLLKALLYFKSIEAGTAGLKLIPNPEEIKKAIAKSNFSEKIKVELSKPENISELKDILNDIYRLMNPREKSLHEIFKQIDREMKQKREK